MPEVGFLDDAFSLSSFTYSTEGHSCTAKSLRHPEIADHSSAAGLERPYLEIYNSFRYSRIMHPEELPDVKLVDGLCEVNRIVFTAAFSRSHQLQRLFVP